MYFQHYKKHKDAKIRESLFWEFNMEEMDFELMKPVIIQRVIERGRLNDFYAILNFYGLEEVKNTIKKLNYLNDKDMAFVSAVFQIRETDLKCYSKKQSVPKHWNS